MINPFNDLSIYEELENKVKKSFFMICPSLLKDLVSNSYGPGVLMK